MSDCLWSFHRLERERFAAAALAVSSIQKRQSFPACTGPNIDAEELSDDDSIRPEDLVKSSDGTTLCKKFLDRLAEILARQKTPPKRKKRRASATDADHASAAILRFKNTVPHIHVAKNAGLDEKDKTFLTKLEAWLRAVSITRQRRYIQRDRFWLDLIEYNNARLKFYVSELATMGNVGPYAPSQLLQDRCKFFERSREKSNSALTDIITDAYLLRYETLPQVLPPAIRLIGLLSRLRAAWETLQAFALHYSSCRDIEIRGIDASEPKEIPTFTIELELDKLQPNLSSKISMRSQGKPWKHLLLHTHAEMQLLLFYGRLGHEMETTEYVRYMGSSKKTCWLCEHTLRCQAGFSSRGSHAEVSPHWTIETKTPLGSQFLETLIEGMCFVQSWLIDHACKESSPRRSAIPQSTPAVTCSGSAATIAKIKHRRKSRSQAFHDKSANDMRRDEVPQALGRRLDRISAIRLPDDREVLEIVTLDICENRGQPESLGATLTVPDFRPFWGQTLHIDQDHQMLEVTKNESQANEGTYTVFHNTSGELADNECIARMLQIDLSSEAIKSQLFWKGDVFIVRFNETAPRGGAYSSLAPGTDMQEVIRLYMQDAWDHQGLEKLRDSKLDLLEFSETHSRNRELVRARL